LFTNRTAPSDGDTLVPPVRLAAPSS